MEHEIDYMSDLHGDSSFHKQSMKLIKVKIKKWFDSSTDQSTVIQQLEEKHLNYPI